MKKKFKTTFSGNYINQERIQTTTTLALANLEKFTKSALSGKRCEKSGKYWIKSEKPGNFEEVHFLPVSAPVNIIMVVSFFLDFWLQ